MSRAELIAVIDRLSFYEAADMLSYLFSRIERLRREAADAPPAPEAP